MSNKIKHKMRCSTCDYWEAFNYNDNGLCRQKSPCPQGTWPTTKAVDWCGKWSGDIVGLSNQARSNKTTEESSSQSKEPVEGQVVYKGYYELDRTPSSGEQGDLRTLRYEGKALINCYVVFDNGRWVLIQQTTSLGAGLST